MKKIPLILLAILLICVFCLYALMQKDEGADRNYIVQSAQTTLAPLSPVSSNQAKELVSAFSKTAPLPATIHLGRVEESSYQGQRVRILTVAGDTVTIRGVTPLMAAPLVRTKGASFVSSPFSLFGYSLLSAQKDGQFIYYLTTEDAAFEISVITSSSVEAKEVLSSLQLISTD